MNIDRGIGTRSTQTHGDVKYITSAELAQNEFAPNKVYRTNKREKLNESKEYGVRRRRKKTRASEKQINNKIKPKTQNEYINSEFFFRTNR